MRHVLPQPVLSLLILGLWLVLAPSPGVGHLLIAIALALGLPWLTRSFWPDPPRLADAEAALRLIGIVVSDIVVANIEVARQVIGPPERLRPGFLEVPLDIEDPLVASLLGSIVSLTPGTVSIEIEGGVLLVHALNVTDAEEAVARIKSRYEAPLKKVFAC
jgi:multicomponent K+:H+ antiporter subunit E